MTKWYKQKNNKRLLVCFFIAGACLNFAPAKATIKPADVIRLMNGDRKANDLSSLVENKLLDKAAEAKGKDMASKGYFAHTSPAGITPWSFIVAKGYAYKSAGENLGIFFNDSQDLENAFMLSPGHRANILNPKFQNVGVAVVPGIYLKKKTNFIIVEFGQPY